MDNMLRWLTMSPKHRSSNYFKVASRIRTSWKALLVKIVVNTARSEVRKEQAEKRRVCTDMAVTERAVSDILQPDGQLLTEEFNAELALRWAALDTHFGRGTLAIVNYRVQGIPWAEIAEHVNLSERMCRYRHKKARRWLSQGPSTGTTKDGHHG